MRIVLAMIHVVADWALIEMVPQWNFLVAFVVVAFVSFVVVFVVFVSTVTAIVTVWNYY